MEIIVKSKKMIPRKSLPIHTVTPSHFHCPGLPRLYSRVTLCRLVCVVSAVVWSVLGVTQAQFGPQCEEIRIPMCRKMPYNLTRLPNLLHHSTQENAQLAIEQFELLGWTKCSDQLDFFLCSMYAPICAVGFVSDAIPPCRSVCEAARQGCEPLLAKFDIPWPTTLTCDALPWYDRGICITPQAIISDVTPKPTPTQVACQCGLQRLFRRKTFKKARFHYALRGTVKTVDTFGELTLTTVGVKEVVKAGRVSVVAGRDAHLWTNRSCACPPLTVDGDYLIGGWEDFANSRLLYPEGSLALPFKRRYARKIQRWAASIHASGAALHTPAPPNAHPGKVYRRKKKRRKRKRRRRKKSRNRKENGPRKRKGRRSKKKEEKQEP